VDLSGHSAGNRLPLFTRKPAPVQITAWGLPRGTGIEAIDYIFSDAVLIPQQAASAFAESVVYLPCWMPYSPLDDDRSVAEAPAGRTGRLTFGSVNRLAKASAGCFAAWAAILRRLPDSRLLILDDLYSVGSSSPFYERMRHAGMPLDRVEIRPRYH